MYDSYQAFADLSGPMRAIAADAERILSRWDCGLLTDPLQRMAGFCELLALCGFTHTRPEFDIPAIEMGSHPVFVEQDTVVTTPFCTLERFRKAAHENEPKILLIAPMSGHFATLLRGTIRTLVRDHEVFVTDWRNARDIPLSAGAFGLEEFVQHVIDFIRHLGPRSHVVAVCQPTVAALAAVALMAEDKDPDQPASLTLMAGPIDTRVAPTPVNDLANKHPIEWFRDNLVEVVPARMPGGGRHVYPGYLQLAAFMSMNVDRHAKSFADLFAHRMKGEFEKARAIRSFYEEYFAIMDLSADFYLQTVKSIFQDCELPRGKMRFRERAVSPRAIRNTFLFTIEGEKDDICAVGQTLAAQDLCSGLRPYMKSHHMQTGVGHYGVFNGRRWESQVYPLLRHHIRSSA
ncbi:polyhydroxyalkanoate depolymerase, intracellular [Rhizobiales bacterium GAS191]|nr:polyhydroxyalkanoate depolymerase, intracellular [Rhizobiales bacterium GAS191]